MVTPLLTSITSVNPCSPPPESFQDHQGFDVNIRVMVPDPSLSLSPVAPGAMGRAYAHTVGQSLYTYSTSRRRDVPCPLVRRAPPFLL